VLDLLRHYLRYTSWPIIVAMVGLIVMGVMSIDLSERAEQAPQGLAVRQTVWAGVAVAAFMLATFVPYQKFGRLAYLLFLLTLGLLVLVFFLKPIRGSHRWISLGGFQLQPSELGKISFIIVLAWYLRFGDHYRRLRGLILPATITFVPMVLILKEPDLGTALLFLPTLYFMLFMAGARLKHLLSIVGIATAVLFVPVPRAVNQNWTRQEIEDRKAISYFSYAVGGREYVVSAAPLAIMENHQVKRIDGWLRQDEPSIIRGKGYQLHQSKMVLGAGRWTGRSDWDDTDAYFRVLPDDHTDFIFAVVGGQWGLAGCALVLLLYGVVFLFGAEIAAITYDPFGRLLAVGVLALLFTQIVVNVGMALGLMPITGMTLPLVSYGGSSLVINCFAIGLLVNVGQRRPVVLGRRPFEYDQRKEKPPAPYGPLSDSDWSPRTNA